MAKIQAETVNIVQQTEVFDLLLKLVSCHYPKPGRFDPLPSAYCDDGKLDIERFGRALTVINSIQLTNAKDDSELEKLCGDAFALLRFVIDSMPLKLSGVSYQSGAIKMYKTSHAQAIESRFVQVGKTPSYLYHGSPITNWHSITHNGIRVMSGTSLMTTGAVWGDGIYLTNQLSRSHGYCGNASDVVIGVYEVYDSEKYKRHLDIHVVPQEDLLLLRYLIWITDKKCDIKSLGDVLNSKLSENAEHKSSVVKSVNIKAMARIKRELKEFTAAGATNISYDEKYSVNLAHGGKKYIIEFPSNFPFSAPLIKCDSVTLDITKTWNSTVFLASLL